MPVSNRNWLALAVCAATGAWAQTPTTGGPAVATTSIAVPPIASILKDTGLVSDDLLNAAAGYVAGVADSSYEVINEALAQPGIPPLERLDPEAYYSYGRSPPVYPSPQGEGTGEWAHAYKKARALVAQMTLEEKNSIVIPASDFRGCSGFVANISRLDFPGICLNDAESGVRIVDSGNVSGFPAQLSVGASWDRGLARQRAVHLGREFKAKGVNVALGPVIGPLGRVAKGGRNWEGFTNDPYLAGSLVAPTVEGLQESVIACAKHFIANEQETNRIPFLQGFLAPLGINLNNSVSSNVDDRAMHELYLWPFYDAVNAGVGSVMASYNRVNNSYASQNSKILNGLLKTELGFEGFVLSDWDAQHTGIASATAGMDLVMPDDTYWGKNQLATAVKNGSLEASRLDDMATRVLAAWYRYAPFKTPGVTPNAAVDARKPASAHVILQSAVEGHVLVKNVDSALPLNKPKTLSLFGYDAILGLNQNQSDTISYGLALANTRAYPNGDAFAGLSNVLHLGGLQLGSIPAIALNGTLITGGGSGGVLPASINTPYDALKAQAAKDGTTLHTDFVSQDPTVTDSDACLVLINAQSAEGSDRSTLADEYSDTLVTNVASQCANTMVVIHNAGIRLVERWIDHPNVTAAIYAHLPGQASGAALVEILYGKQSPSGRLPYTVAKNESDYGALLDPTLPSAQDPQYSQSNFSEGVVIDYRHFLQAGIKPRFAFGYGLTYSNFSYCELSVSLAHPSDVEFCPEPPESSHSSPRHGWEQGNEHGWGNDNEHGWDHDNDHDHTWNHGHGPAHHGHRPSTRPPPGGHPSLSTILATVSATVTNTGSVAAAEVAQLYLGIPNSGVPRALRGFSRHLLQPGEQVKVEFPLRRRDLSLWDVQAQQWVLQQGAYQVLVGKSVEDVVLRGEFSVMG